MPRCLLVGGSTSAVIINLSRERTHLRPFHWRWRPWPTIPNCYWLLLLVGDIHVNPGPAHFPCTICDNPVLDDHRGVCCDLCDQWTHADCARVNEDEYKNSMLMQTWNGFAPVVHGQRSSVPQRITPQLGVGHMVLW